jgi:hypothetical protein
VSAGRTRQRSPISGATRAGSGPKRPEGEIRQPQVGFAVRVTFDQIAEVVETDRTDVLRRDVVETAEVDFFAGEGMNQQRLIGEADVGPRRAHAAGFAWPLRPVGRSGEPVGALVEVGAVDAELFAKGFYRTVFVADVVAHQDQCLLRRVV